MEKAQKYVIPWLDQGIQFIDRFQFTRETLDYPVKPDNDRHMETRQPCSKLTVNIKFKFFKK